MTIKELIEELKKYDNDQPIFFHHNTKNDFIIERIYQHLGLVWIELTEAEDDS